MSDAARIVMALLQEDPEDDLMEPEEFDRSELLDLLRYRPGTILLSGGFKQVPGQHASLSRHHPPYTSPVLYRRETEGRMRMNHGQYAPRRGDWFTRIVYRVSLGIAEGLECLEVAIDLRTPQADQSVSPSIKTLFHQRFYFEPGKPGLTLEREVLWVLVKQVVPDLEAYCAVWSRTGETKDWDEVKGMANRVTRPWLNRYNEVYRKQCKGEPTGL